MRAAMLNLENFVINYAEVSGFDDRFIDPLDSVIGSYWNGISFDNPVPPTPSAPDATDIITASYNASLVREAEKLEADGKTFEAVQLLLKAQGK